MSLVVLIASHRLHRWDPFLTAAGDHIQQQRVPRTDAGEGIGQFCQLPHRPLIQAPQHAVANGLIRFTLFTFFTSLDLHNYHNYQGC